MLISDLQGSPSSDVEISSKAAEKHGDHMRRNSTGKLSFYGNRPIPHYRTTSTGSCHDICKYGKPHPFEEKAKAAPPWQVVRKRGEQVSSRRASLPATNTAENTKQNAHLTSIKTPVSDYKGRKKVDISHLSRNGHISVKTELNKMNASTFKPLSSYTPEINNVGSSAYSNNGEIFIKEASPCNIDVKITTDSEPKPSSFSSGTEICEVEALAESQNTERYMKTTSHSDLSKGAAKNREFAITTSINEIECSKTALSYNTETNHMIAENSSRKIKHPALKNPRASVGSPKLKTPPTRNSMVCLKSVSPNNVDTRFIKDSDFSSRMNSMKERSSSTDTFKCSADRRNGGMDSCRHAVKSSERKIPSPSLQPIPSSRVTRKTTSNTHYTDKMRKAKPGKSLNGKDDMGAVVLKPLLIASSPKRTQSFGSRNKKSSRVGMVMKSPKVTKKTESRAVLPVTNRNIWTEGNKLGSRKKLLYPKKSPPSSSHISGAPSGSQFEPGCHDSSCGIAEENKHIMKEKKTLKTLSGLANGKRKPKSFAPGNEGCVVTKVKFRRGKVVDTAPHNIRAPRRLKFRQVRLLADKKGPVSIGWRQSFKRTDEAITRGTDRETEHEKVVLRHQNIQEGEKKDAQGLLNMVIKETASKLVMTRKSKVKALVGAFESVISLQEAAKSQLNTMVL